MQAKQNAQTDISKAQHAQLPVPAQETKLTTTTQQPSKEQPYALPTIGEDFMIGLTAVIAIMAVLQAWIFHRQWRVMRDQLTTMGGQLAEMKTTSDQLDKLVQEAKENADAGKLYAQSFKRSVQMEQRAWIQISQIICTIGVDNPVSGQVAIVNSGHTPALEVKAFIRVETAPYGRFRIQPPDSKDEARISPIIPYKLPGYIRFNMQRSGPLSQADWDELVRREREMFVHGIISYEDIFGVKHWTQYCFILNPSIASFVFHDKYNAIDKNE